MKQVTVIILNWNGCQFLKKFIPIVIKHSSKDAEIVVADNNSSDDSVEFLKTNYPEVRIIQNEYNAGFASGYNLALKQIKTKYYVLLNSDVEVTKNWINPLIQLMEKDETIAACQPKLLSYYQRDAFEYAGAAGGYIDKYGYPFCRGRIFNSLEKDTGQYDDVVEIFWASGASLFVRAHLFHQVGGLDDDFFTHMEEIDLCWRFKNQGYKIIYCPDSVIYHVGGGTLPKTSFRKTYFNFRNNLFLLYKNLPKSYLWKVFIARFFLDGIASIKFLMEGGYKDAWAVIRAHLSFYKHFTKLSKKRSGIQHKEVSNIYRSNIVFDYFLFKTKKFYQLKSNKFTT